jgi:hypothetical protein
MLNYYTPYQFDYSISKSDHISASLNYDCAFLVDRPDTIEYYSAWRCDNEDYFMNRFLNPYFGYRFQIEADLSNTTFRVAFTNGNQTLYPSPNATVTEYYDGTQVVRLSNGTISFFPAGSYNYWEYDVSSTSPKAVYNTTKNTTGK